MVLSNWSTVRKKSSQLLNLPAFVLSGTLIFGAVSLEVFDVGAKFGFPRLRRLLSSGMLFSSGLIGLVSYFQVDSHFFDISSERFIERSGLLVRQTEQLEMFRIQDISVSRSFLFAPFDLGTVTLLTRDRSTPVVKMPLISKPEETADLMRQLVEEAKRRSNISEIDFE